MHRMLPMITEPELVVTRQIVSINYLQVNHSNPKANVGEQK
jgi:hypothetical protein